MPKHPETPDLTGLEIAVVGMACRFPGARNVEEFWSNLERGVESIHFLSDDELRALGEPPARFERPEYVKVARRLDGIDLFDAAFFGISPREAELLDPQHRFFLECAWEAMEDAGYYSEGYAGLIGIYGGTKISTYQLNVLTRPDLMRALGEFQARLGIEKDYLTTRTAYKLGLGGPAVTVQTACSTALVATHLACQALLAGECEMALAGGVAISANQSGYVYREGEIFSADGRIRAFDAGANGTVFGSGVGLVVLKRLEDALADGDRIRALIKGSAINNDRGDKIGYTAPSVEGQARVIRAAQLAAEVDPATISYVEAHGTGTPTGDPIEVAALTRAFREATAEKSFCALGSVKTNVGHLGAAAGVAGLIKTVLALENAKIPASLLYEKPNPQIDFDASPFFVNAELRDWRRDGAPRRAGLSSFGIGGTNAHVILEEAPPAAPGSESRPWQLLLLSARSAAALDRATANLARHLERHPDLRLPDAAFTLQVGRRPFEHRRMAVAADSPLDAARVLGDRRRTGTAVCAPLARPVAFLFSGQGAQYPGMGEDLYRRETVFRDAVDRSSELLRAHLEVDLRDLLYPPARGEEAAAALRQTRYAQPALFVVEVALAELWRAWGVEPAAMAGHSIGEYAAAHLAGVLSLEDALGLVAARGRLMQGLAPGAMLAVPLAADELAAELGPELEIAAVNAPDRTVVSGPEEAIAALAERLAERQVAGRRLHTSHAFHSPMMEPILAAFADEVSRVELRPPQRPFLSNLSGTWITEAEARDPGYWVRHLRYAVRFADAVGELCRDPGRILLEVGPGDALARLVRRHGAFTESHRVLSSIRAPRVESDDQAFLLGRLGELWLAGGEVDWAGFYRHERRSRVPLPTYPFERQRHWVEPNLAAAAAPARRDDVGDWFYLPTWSPSLAAPPPAAGAGGSWLLFLDELGLGARLAARLGELGRRVATVAAGDTFRRLGDDAWEIVPGRREDYDALFRQLDEAAGTPRHVIHLWNVTGDDDPDLDVAQDRGFFSLVYLAQALGSRSPGGPVDLAAVCDRLHAVDGEPRPCPEKATLLGPCQVIPKEYPDLRSCAVEVELPASEALIDALLGEAEHPSPGAVVAYRAGRRLRRDLVPVEVGAAIAERSKLRRRGVYLITGGLGGFGLTFAEYLARELEARLVLAGRSAPSDAELRRIEELEKQGAEVVVAQVDVADAAALGDLVAGVRERFGALHGVIHAAGVAGGGMIQRKRREEAEAVLRPKVRGTLALVQALGDEPLDFLVLCSSTIAFLGTLGQVDYCAANCFLDAFAEACRAGGGTPVVSINWGAWQEVGMAARGPSPAARGLPAAPPAAAGPHPLIDRVERGDGGEVVYAGVWNARRHWVLDEHRVAGVPAAPGTAYLELVRAAFAHHTGGATAEIRELSFLSLLTVPDDESREVRLVLLPRDERDFRFRVESRESATAPWNEIARGAVAALAAADPQRRDLAAIRDRCRRETPPLGRDGRLLTWGPRWECLRSLRTGDGEALAELQLPDELAADLAEMKLHPALVDVATALTRQLSGAEGGYLPLSYRGVRVYGALPARLLGHLRLARAADETVSAGVSLLDVDGVERLAIERFTMKRVGPPAARAATPATPFAADGIRPEQGVEVLRRVLSRVDQPRIAVSAKPLGGARPAPAAAPPAAAPAVPRAARSLRQRAGGSRPRNPRPVLATEFVAPASETERRLAEVWEDVLGLEEIGVNDSFFELGGDSLQLTQAATRVRDSLGVDLALGEFFEASTVAELAARLDRLGPERSAPTPETPALVPVLRDGGPLPLSFGQQRLWVLAQLEPGNPAYNLTTGVRLRGPLDVAALDRCFAEILRRHEVLRSVFDNDDGRPALRILEPDPHPLRIADLARLQAAAERQAHPLAVEEVQQPFELARGPLCRFRLLRLGDADHVLIATVHHIVADAWSFRILIRELIVLYQAFHRGEASPLPELAVHYADFARWQRQWFQGVEVERQVAYWRRQLADIPGALALPSDRPRPAIQTFRGMRQTVTLPRAVGDSAAALAKESGATLFMVLVAAFKALVYRYTGRTDLALGTPIANRTRRELEGMIGFFANTLVLRTDLAGDPSFAEIVERVRKVALEAYDHQDLPFEQLVAEVAVERDLATSPLFQIFFIFQNAPVRSQRLEGDLYLSAFPILARAARFDWTVELQDSPAGITGYLEYNTDLFDASTIRRVLRHFEILLAGAAAAPAKSLSELALLSPPQRFQMLREWNDTAAKPDGRTLPELFAARAAHSPDAVAVVFDDRELTCGALCRGARSLARRLRRRGVGPEVRVGLAVERSLDLVTGLLGILAAGGAYVPLDPAYPRQRIAFMLADSGARIVVTQEHLRQNLPRGVAAVLCGGDEARAAAAGEPVRGENLAYVIYTSGSTGRPKGVQISHAALTNFLRSMERQPGLGPDDVMLAVTSPSFDIAGLELFLPLVAGARVVVASREDVVDGRRLRALLATRRASAMQGTPATWRLLAEPGWDGGHLRVLCGGEALPAELAAALRERSHSVWNLYGPTETTVWSAVSKVEAGGPILVGRPIANTGVHLLDRRLRPLPAGAVGELHVGGAGLARGYLGRPARTAGAFVPHPWSAVPGERLYKTGDLARHRADGRLECLGRIDHQVKIRGFRIELGEIESRLAAAPGVRQAVVVARRAAGDARLAAYVVPEGNEAPPAGALRRFLEERLPAYMVPSAFVDLETLPLTPNGKVDRKALAQREPRRPEGAGEPAATRVPKSEGERIIADVWRDVLGVERVGTRDNFFDLGGHSLLLVEVRARLEKTLQREIRAVDLFRYPTVEALARFLDVERSAGADAAAGLRRAELRRAAGERRESDVAIVGMSGRFPSAPDLEAFWRNLRDGVESVVEFSDEELLAAGVPAATLGRPGFVKAGAPLDGVELFDAALFGISAREAELMDPQQRIFLECAWEALESAGCDPETFDGRVGVFAGVSMNRYWFHLLSSPERLAHAGGLQLLLANDKDFLPTRVSYKLGLGGPSVNVQTACSTSLVAVHMACQSLLARECDAALVGAVAAKPQQKSGYFYEEEGILSPDGHCRAFDARAAGTVGGNGAGVVVLKRLAEALEAGDVVHAVIKGTAINNDGSTKVGFTAPSVAGQAAVIAEAQRVAGVEPRDIGYVEAHGTGTRLGDPIEVAALNEVFGREPGRRCALGSVKTNIGHLDTAAGIAGLLKTVLALTHRQIPPSLHFERPNPEIDFASGIFEVASALADWPADGAPRRAGVSSFGLGGTNAHVVVEEAPRRQPSGPSRPRQLLVLSAASADALAGAGERLAAHLEAHPEEDLADAAFTLQSGRKRLAHRRCLVCRDAAEAVAKLRDPASGGLLESFEERTSRPVAFLFSGLGDHYVGMGRELYEHEPAFSNEVDRASRILEPLLGVDLAALLYGAGAHAATAPGLDLRQMLGRQGDTGESPLDETRLVQPAVFVVEVALARLWMEWGLEPEAMIGYSLGEYAAAHLAGVLSFDDALTLVARRAQLIDGLPRGAMLAVTLPEAELAPLLGAELSLAATHGPDVTVAAGPEEAVAELAARLAGDGHVCRRLRTRHAFHSTMMRPIADAFAEEVGRVDLQEPRIPYLSNVTGTWITADEATDADYWVRHMCRTVRFAEGLGELLESPERVLLEVGPGQGVGSAVRQHPALAAEQVVVSSLRDGRERVSDLDFALKTLGRLWLAGAAVDWRGFSRHERRRRVELPTYAFDRRRYWIDAQSSPRGVGERPPKKASDVGDWLYAPVWRSSPAPAGPPRPEGRWLVFADAGELGSLVVERLRAGGADVVRVSPGERCEPAGDGAWTIDPRRPVDYAALVRELAPFAKVVHLWSVAGGGQETPEARTAGALDLGFFSLLHLGQALATEPLAEPLELVAVTAGVHDVDGREELSPEPAVTLGPVYVLPQEIERLASRNVDLAPADGRDLERAVDQLAAELVSGATERIVAYRGRRRWLPEFEPLRVEPSPGARLRSGGTYLVTGGLGGMGLVFAEHLARSVGARLVLVGRSAVPARGEWEAWIASHEDGDPLRRKLEKLLEIERLGAEIEIASADVADRDRMSAALAAARQRFGAIHGVIHAAGVAGGGVAQLKTRDAALEVLRPKVAGTAVLADLVAGEPLDFFAMCSSVSGILAAVGQIDYCAANAYQDAFARAWKGPGLAVSVNWDLWREVGLAVDTAAGAERREERLATGIAPREGVDALERALAAGLSQIVVTPQDFRRLVEVNRRMSAATHLEHLERQRRAAPAAHARPQLAVPFVEPANDRQRRLAEIWREILGVEPIGVRDSFFDLGGNSLVGIRMIPRLRDAFGVKLTLQDLFEAPTIGELDELVARGGEGQAPQASLETLLNEIEGLSEEELEDRLSVPVPETSMRNEK